MNQIIANQAPGKRRSRTRKALCSALLSLLEEQSLEQITIKELTARAGVGYATYFRLYEDKQDLLHDLAHQEISRLLAMSLPIFYTVDSLASTLALCGYVWEQRKIWKVLLTGGAAATLKEEYLRQAMQVMEEWPNPELWIPDDLAVTFAVTALVEILGWWLKQPDPPSVQEMAGVVNRLAVAPLLPGEGKPRTT